MQQLKRIQARMQQLKRIQARCVLKPHDKFTVKDPNLSPKFYADRNASRAEWVAAMSITSLYIVFGHNQLCNFFVFLQPNKVESLQ
ncbi:hypothetical protein pb186bvf_011260 [Paramecium bursaria]